jgi:four helix bundle protein
MQSFKKLIVWQKSFDLALQVCKETETFPTHTKFEIASQIRRSAVSVPSNIAEGMGRSNPGELAQFLRIARGSATELETQILICEKLGYISPELSEAWNNTLEEIQKMLTVFHKKIKGN